MNKFVFGALAASVMAISTSTMANFVAGKDYQVVATPVKTDHPNKVEVREFFWYGCGHCFALEPHMQKWIRSMPKGVYFVRTPAAMNPEWERNARGYYVTEYLQVRRKVHLPLFHEIHVNGKRVFDQASQAKFYAAYGIPEAKFNSLFESFPISSKIAQAKKLAMKYQLTGVPAVTVNGKYVVQGNDAKVAAVVTYLVEKELKAK